MKSKIARLITPATAVILVITSSVTILQFAFPEILTALRRDPHALADGEWWRMVTPLLVHADGWLQFIVNMFYLILIGTTVERQCGSTGLLFFYFTGGIAGEIAGYVSWDLYGAGASVGVFGVIGALYVMMMHDRQMEVAFLPLIAMLGLISSLLVMVVDQTWVQVGMIMFFMAVFFIILQRRNFLLLKYVVIWTGLIGSVLLVVLHDIHGVSILAGALSFLIFNRKNKQTGQVGM